jgi:hypothetical protein
MVDTFSFLCFCVPEDLFDPRNWNAPDPRNILGEGHWRTIPVP